MLQKREKHRLSVKRHVHSGQFRLPFIGGIIAPDQGLFPQYDVGIYTEKETNYGREQRP